MQYTHQNGHGPLAIGQTMSGAIIPTSAIRPDRGTKKRPVVAEVEWHPGELYPRVGFVVTNLSRPAEQMVAFYYHCGTAERYIKEGKNVTKSSKSVVSGG